MDMSSLQTLQSFNLQHTDVLEKIKMQVRDMKVNLMVSRGRRSFGWRGIRLLNSNSAIYFNWNFAFFLPKIGSWIHPRTFRNSDTTEHVVHDALATTTAATATAAIGLRRAQRRSTESVGQRVVLVLLVYTARVVVQQGCKLATATGLYEFAATEQQLEFRGAVQTSSPGES